MEQAVQNVCKKTWNVKQDKINSLKLRVQKGMENSKHQFKQVKIGHMQLKMGKSI